MPTPTHSICRPPAQPLRPSTRLCLVCHAEFLPQNAVVRVCSLRCRFALWAIPEQRMAEAFCTYCGDVSTTVDHVPPQMSWDALAELAPHIAQFTVPACRDCNCSILGASALWTLPERTQRVVDALLKRHKELLNGPVWEDDEIAELGPGLRSVILAGEHKRRHVEARLKHADAALRVMELNAELFPAWAGLDTACGG